MDFSRKFVRLRKKNEASFITKLVVMKEPFQIKLYVIVI